MPRMPVSTVYVENSNNKSTLEDVMCANDVTLTFQNQRFGSNSQFSFSRSYQFLGPIICNFEVKYAGAGDATLLNNCGVLSDYIAHAMIAEYYFTVGGTELLRIRGPHLVPIQLERVESEMKKRKILECSGVRQARTVNGYLSNDKIIKYQCLLELPWSTIATKKLDSRKYFPLHQLSEALELSIVLRPKNEVFQDKADSSAVTLESASINFEYQKIGNPEMLKQSIYRFPFTFPDCRNIPVTYKNGEKVIADLTGFRKGEVNMIQFHVINESVQKVAATDTNIAKNFIYDGNKLKNVVLRFNGQIIWRSNGSDDLWDLVYSDQPAVHGMKKLASTGDIATKFILHKDQDLNFSTAPTAGQQVTNQLAVEKYIVNYGYCGVSPDGHAEKYYYNIPIAQILDKYKKHGHVLGADFTKNQVQLEFDFARPQTNDSNLRIYATYYYQCMYQNDGESSLLVF